MKFKIRCSQISKIMGDSGITEKQIEELNGLLMRKNGEGRPLTEKQEEKMGALIEKRDDTRLPTGCISYLKEWYEEFRTGHKNEISTKYTDKGNLCEGEAIWFLSEKTGIPMLKNERFFENDFMTGTPDIVLFDSVRDTKCSWDYKTFLASVMSEKLENAYWWQMQGYLHLTGSFFGSVDYCLMDTPAECNWDEPVSFANIPNSERHYSFHVEYSRDAIEKVEKRVAECREWLEDYDKKVKARFK